LKPNFLSNYSNRERETGELLAKLCYHG